MMFVPFMLFTGPIRAITGQISLVVIAVLTFSLIESFFILPAHLRHMKHVEPSQNRLLRFQTKIADSLNTFAVKIFRPIIAQLIHWRYVTVSAFIGLFCMAMALLFTGVAPVAFLPEVEADMIQFSARFPEGTTFKRLNQVRNQLDSGIAEVNEKAKSDFEIDWDLITKPATIAEGNRVEGYLGINPDRPGISTKMIADKLEEYVGPIPDAYRVNYGTTEGGGDGGGGLYYGVASADPEALEIAIKEIKEQIESYAQVPRAWDGLESSAREIQFTLKPGAETLGITLQDVTRQVREAFFGREVQRLPRNGEDVRVMVRYPEDARESLSLIHI